MRRMRNEGIEDIIGTFNSRTLTNLHIWDVFDETYILNETVYYNIQNTMKYNYNDSQQISTRFDTTILMLPKFLPQPAVATWCQLHCPRSFQHILSSLNKIAQSWKECTFHPVYSSVPQRPQLALFYTRVVRQNFSIWNAPSTKTLSCLWAWQGPDGSEL